MDHRAQPRLENAHTLSREHAGGCETTPPPRTSPGASISTSRASLGAIPLLLIEDLTKRFPGQARPAVDGVDLEVRDGEILGLVGLNGAGKTTTIRVGVGVSLPSGGRVLIDGQDIVREKRLASARVGWVPEGFPYELNARALPLLTYLAGFHGLHGSKARERGHELLVRVGLPHVERARLRTLSLGMKKRFALASAMVGEPPNILLDEILNGLDPQGMAFARKWLLDERRAGRAILLSSHLLTELQAVADRIAFLHGGRVIQIIDHAELATQGKHVLRLSVENLDAAALEYLASVGEPRVEGSSVVLSAPRVTTAELNAELNRRGYRVSELRAESESLEAYFLRLIGSAP